MLLCRVRLVYWQRVGIKVGVIVTCAEPRDLVKKIQSIDSTYDSLAYDLVKTRLLECVANRSRRVNNITVSCKEH